MAVSYKLYQNDKFLKEVTELEAVVDKLAANTSYTFVVSTTDGVDESAKSAPITVTTSTVAVIGITLDKTTHSMVKGGSVKLIATIKPDNASNKTVTWSTSDSAIATVDSAGTVKSIKVGSATIAAKSNNGKVATCVITVTSGLKAPTGLVASGITATSVKLTWVKGV